jgi:glutamine---fructose-6-phosphate transaminase (isomerizing)
MNKNGPRYNRFHLVREMYETVGFIRNYSSNHARDLFTWLPATTPIMLTGEGSSRIFPARNAVQQRLTQRTGPLLFTESSTDLRDKDLSDFIVIGASNSGKTKELVNLFRRLITSGHDHVYGLTCNHGTLLSELAKNTIILDTGIELAVAATKSVVAQAMFYDSLMLQWDPERARDNVMLSYFFEQSLDAEIQGTITEAICKAEMVYFTGNNNGVAEELTLKTNEIIRKKSAYLPGTYLLHGVEEVITSNDVIIMVDTYPEEFEKIRSIYTDSIGTPVVAISTEPTPFHTVKIPAVPLGSDSYIKLATGWNMLVESGIMLGIDLDKPQRARKIGNEAGG